MRMSQDGLNKIVELLKNVLSGHPVSSAMTISNRQYSGIYYNVFLEEAERNHDAIGYDDFSEELWRRLGRNESDDSEKLNEFMDTWEAWVDLYRHLKKNNKLKS